MLRFQWICLLLPVLSAQDTGVFLKTVTNDQTAQNETPVAVNPRNSRNIVTGANDWNYNDGCAVSATLDGGRTWTSTLPNGFLPGVTRFTNDPNVPGTGAYDAGGDPAIAFGPDGTAYYVCQAFNFTPPHEISLLMSRSTDGGVTWLSGGSAQPLTKVAVWNGNGKSKGSNGQFQDHESIYIDKSPTSPYYGSIYVTWAQFNGQSHSPILVAVSRDRGVTFSTPVAVTSGSTRSNQDARIVSAPNGDLFLTFDSTDNGGKDSVIYVSKSTDGGAKWSAPALVAKYVNPVCLFPPYCFNISGGAFRAGSYAAPAYDAVRNRLYVIYPDIANHFGEIFFTSAPAGNLASWSTPRAIGTATGDRFQAEISVAPTGRVDVMFYDRSYSLNTLVDVTYGMSNDGGASWSTRRASAQSFDPSQWGVPSGTSFRPFLGDYNGIASTADNALLTWTGVGATGAPFNLEIVFARITP